MAVEDYLYGSLVAHMPFTPSEDQQRLFRSLAAFLHNQDSIFILNGYAGTGKTTAMSALVGTLKEMNLPVVLLAPTGRSAKVLAGYTGTPAHTIHKTIYRQVPPKANEETEYGAFSLHPNKSKNTLFIVDEASLLSNTQSGSIAFGSGRLLDDLMTYVQSASGNKVLLLGDSAQLPPIGLDLSPALDISYMERYGNVMHVEMSQVLRQAAQSGILYNATLLRHHITAGIQELPAWKTEGFTDIHRITGGDLIECISEAVSHYGLEEVVVLCRSNKRANRYNNGIRSTVLYREEELTRSDRVMVVKNCYQFVDKIEEMDFIANGDIAQVMRIHKYQERYGFHFAQATLQFPDYHNVELDVRVLLDTLESTSPALTPEQQELFYKEVALDYAHIKSHTQRYKAIREDSFLNALQIKYATAVTCHKAQGGQWKVVFVDKSFFDEICTIDALRWYYTAFTRAQEQLYLVNF